MVRCLSHVLLYIYSMNRPGIAHRGTEQDGWLPRALAAVIGVTAGRVFRPAGRGAAGPHGRERGKNLLWAAGRLAD